MGYILEKIEEIPILTEKVYKMIRNAIINHTIPPGTKLTVDTLSKELNVSRTPVKEALVMLEREGLVEFVPRKGAFVATLTLEDIEEIYDLREILEGLSAKKASIYMDEESLLKLSQIVEESQRYVEEKNHEKYSDLDEEFHRIIRISSRNKRLIKILDNIEGQIRLLMATSITLPGRIDASFEEHKRILSALKKRDPELAERYTREHIRAVRESVFKSLKGYSTGGNK